MDERAPVTAEILFRQAGPADLEATYEVFVAAADDLRARSGRPPIDDTPQRRAWAIPFRRHALAHDAERFWVAEAKGRVAGFGIATLRERLWYLAALHVLPSFQGRGVGRELLQRCLAAVDGPGAVRIVISESTQPVSNALYATHGMYPWAPILHMEGAIPAGMDGQGLDREIVVGEDEALWPLHEIDRAVLGTARPVDHLYWLGRPGLTGLLFRRRGKTVGYAYASASGQVGPAAVRSPTDLPHVVSASLRSAAELGATRASLVVPGHCRAAVAHLLANGFRYGESINLLLASRPFGHLDRYLVSAGDALF